MEQVCAQLPTSADNMALPTFATVPRCGVAVADHQPYSKRSISPARRAQAANLLQRHAVVKCRDRQADGDARPLHRPCPAYYEGSANNYFWQKILPLQFQEM